MGNRFFEIIEKDLKLVDETIDKFLKLKAGNAREFAHLNISSIDRYLRPGLVILSARLFNKSKHEQETPLAAVVQLIYLANSIHQGVKDSKDIPPSKIVEVNQKEDSQYPVLIGTYFYGRYFQLLCDYQLFEFLKPLSEIICKIYEGSIMRKEEEMGNKRKYSELEQIRKETAELIAGCCSLGAKLGGASPTEQRIMYHFGLTLGMAYGLIDKGVKISEVEGYIQESKEILNQLGDSNIKNLLLNFLSKFPTRKIALKEVMIV